MNKAKVLFIGGYGRSGSTIIELLLSNVPHVTVLGEIRHLFGRVVDDRELCGCGVEVINCPYWKDVLSKAFPEGFEREKIYQAFKAINKVAALPSIVIPKLRSKSMQRHIEVYTEAFSAIYKAIHEITGAEVLVDPSKYPMHGLVLGLDKKNIEMSTMLLVRNPKAVAHSWENPKIRPEIKWEKRLMPKHNFIRSALAWNASNLLTYLGSKINKTQFRTQLYEDFTNKPLEQIKEIASFAFDKNIELDDSIFELNHTKQHKIAGNPLSGTDKKIKIKTDERWKFNMNKFKQIIVSLICLPLMIKYGYRL